MHICLWFPWKNKHTHTHTHKKKNRKKDENKQQNQHWCCFAECTNSGRWMMQSLVFWLVICTLMNLANTTASVAWGPAENFGLGHWLSFCFIVVLSWSSSFSLLPLVHVFLDLFLVAGLSWVKWTLLWSSATMISRKVGNTMMWITLVLLLLL